MSKYNYGDYITWVTVMELKHVDYERFIHILTTQYGFRIRSIIRRHDALTSLTNQERIHEFNFNLERVTQAMNTGFISAPQGLSGQERKVWVKQALQGRELVNDMAETMVEVIRRRHEDMRLQLTESHPDGLTWEWSRDPVVQWGREITMLEILAENETYNHMKCGQTNLTVNDRELAHIYFMLLHSDVHHPALLKQIEDKLHCNNKEELIGLDVILHYSEVMHHVENLVFNRTPTPEQIRIDELQTTIERMQSELDALKAKVNK